MQNITGVVLCGGLSARMGRDKGLIHTDNGNWAKKCERLLNNIPVPVLISINSQQQNSYSSHFPEAQLISDAGNFDLRGPLLGILSVHEKFPKDDLLVLACDMQNMSLPYAEKLLAVYTENKGFDAFLFSQEHEPEPLFGIYCQQALENIYLLASTGNLEKYSMKSMLSRINVYYLSIEEKDKSSFFNFNTGVKST